MSHGDKIEAIPAGLPHRPAVSDGAPIAATADEKRRFSTACSSIPEVVHTPDGGQLIANFVRHVCGLAGDWTMAEFRATKIAEIRKQVGNGKVICGLSGGVDSAVAAVLIHEAIGDQLTCVFVDHGLMRANEAEQVVSLFRNAYNIPLVHVDAEVLFCPASQASPTRGEAQVHRQDLHRRVRGGSAQDRRRRIPAQGTLYPDVIESVSFTGGPRSPSRATTMSAACPSG
jgi:GMP synthase (glutamine-hydrolysing)